MKSLITALLLGLFISSQAQNISQSQVRQFNAVPAYRVFGRGAGVGTPSFITLDSNHVPQLHSQGYYDGRYLTGGTASIFRTTRGDSLAVGATKVMDKDNPNNSPWYLRNNLRWLEYNQNNVSRGTSDFAFGILGDSKIEFQLIPQELIQALGAKVRMKGQGYVPFAGSNPTAFNAGALNPLTTWTVKTIGTGGKNLALYSLVSTGSSVPIGWTTNGSGVNEWNFFTDLEIGYYGQAGGGSFEVYVDNVLKTTVNTSLTTGVQKATVTGLTDVAHSVKITPLAANVELLHFNLYRTSSGLGTGYYMHQIGHSGGQVSDYLNVDTSLWNPQFRNLNINLLAVYLGTNERSLGVLPSVFKDNVHTLLTRLKAVSPRMDIVLWGQVDEDTAGIYFHSAPYTVKQYNDILRQVAIEDSVAFFDVDQLASNSPTNQKKGWLSDGLHESQYGAYNEAANFFNGLQTIAGLVNVTEQIRKQTGVEIYNKGLGGAGINSPTAALATLTTTGTVNLSGFQINTGNPLSVGTGTSSIGLKFVTTNQGAVVNNWSFENVYGTTQARDWNQSSNIININQGWGAPTGASSRANTINITGFINSPTGVKTQTVGGIYYNPALTALGSLRHRFIENTSGDALFGTSSGQTGIGANTEISSSAILDVNTNDTLNYKGSLPIPRLTTAKRDSIVKGLLSVALTNGGTGYTTGATITFSGSGGGTATATFSSGVLTGITVNKQGKYLTAPTVIITGSGSGATATATLAPLPEGLHIYNLDTHTVQYWNGTVWKNVLTD